MNPDFKNIKGHHGHACEQEPDLRVPLRGGTVSGGQSDSVRAETIITDSSFCDEDANGIIRDRQS